MDGSRIASCFMWTFSTHFTSGVLNAPCYNVIIIISDLHTSLFYEPGFLNGNTKNLFKYFVFHLRYLPWIMAPKPVDTSTKEYIFFHVIYLFMKTNYPFVDDTVNIISSGRNLYFNLCIGLVGSLSTFSYIYYWYI